nr:MAG TPA: hypothetical protein [Caudoviricetes sp.]
MIDSKSWSTRFRVLSFPLSARARNCSKVVALFSAMLELLSEKIRGRQECPSPPRLSGANSSAKDLIQHLGNFLISRNLNAVQLDLVLLGHQTICLIGSRLISGVLCGDAKTNDILLGHISAEDHMTLIILTNLLEASFNRLSGRVSIDHGLLTIDLDVAVDLGLLHLSRTGGDILQCGSDLALNGGHHGGVLVLVTTNTGNDTVQLGDGSIHRGSVIGVILNPLSNLSQSIQGLLGAIGDQLSSQLLVGDGTGALTSILTDQSGQIGAGSLAVQNSLQSSIQIGLRNLSLVGQSGQTRHRNILAGNRQGAVGSTRSDQNVHHLVGDGQGNAIDLNAYQRLGFDLADLTLGALSQKLQLFESSVLRHKYVLLKNICLRRIAENIIENVLHLFVGSGIAWSLRIFRRYPGRLERIVKDFLNLCIRSSIFPDDLKNLGLHISVDMSRRHQLRGVKRVHDLAGQTPYRVFLDPILNTGNSDFEIDSGSLQTLSWNNAPVIRQRHRRLLYAAGFKDSRFGITIPTLVKVELHNIELVGVLYQTLILDQMGISFFHCDLHRSHLLIEQLHYQITQAGSD